MTLINKRGAVRERKLISYSIDVGKEKKDRKSIMFFQYPGDVKGKMCIRDRPITYISFPISNGNSFYTENVDEP